MAGASSMKLAWQNTPEPVEIMHTQLKDGAVMRIFRMPNGTWSVGFYPQPVHNLSKLSEAQDVASQLALRWQGGLAS